MLQARADHTRESWPIATCLHGFAPVDADGVPLQDAAPAVWQDLFAQIAEAGFSYAEVADSHFRPAELDADRRNELIAIAGAHGVQLPSVHVQRASVIDPSRWRENLDYAHRTIDAAAAMGMTVFSTGLHQPLTEEQRRVLWFWRVPGHRDPDDPQVFSTAVARLRELGRHAAEVGLLMSLEMYEDTYLGTADSAVRLVEEIDLDNVGINPDIGNLVRLDRPQDWRTAYARTLPYANYWHVKNYLRDEAPDGSWVVSAPTSLELGLINYRQVVRDAVALGFRGIFLMEQYGGDSLGVCATNQRYLRTLLPATL